MTLLVLVCQMRVIRTGVCIEDDSLTTSLSSSPGISGSFALCFLGALLLDAFENDIFTNDAFYHPVGLVLMPPSVLGSHRLPLR